MRNYPLNSPQAATRIVALAMIADGHFCQSEIDTLRRLGVHEKLGLTPDEFHDVIQEFCEDLLSGSKSEWSDACQIDSHLMSSLMAEIDDPSLRMNVLNLCVAAVEADGHVATAEELVLVSTVECWGLQHHMFQR